LYRKRKEKLKNLGLISPEKRISGPRGETVSVLKLSKGHYIKEGLIFASRH
jgi:hypothetical protein